MAFSDWSASSDTTNGTTSGVNIAENCDAANLNNWGRRIMTQLRAAITTALDSFLAGSSALPIANGGTAGTTAAAARTALSAAGSGANSDITSLTGLTTPLAAAYGGTGAASAAAALTALGAAGYGTVSLGSSASRLDLTIGATTVRIQTGTGTLGANTGGSITYPVAYSTWSVCVVSGGPTGTSSEGDVHTYSAATTTGVAIVNSGAGSGHYHWIAIGV